MKFCVIGAGSGGRAFTAYLSSKGYNVSLYNRSFSRISDIMQKGGIHSLGELEGYFKVDINTLNLEKAVKDVDIIMVVTPASSHRDIAENLAPHLKEGQIIILNPGRTFGSIEFSQIVEKIRGKLPIFVCETQTLLFTSRALEENKVKIIKIKNNINFSCYPDKYTDIIYEIIKDIFPQLNPVDDYLEVTLNNIGMLVHPTISLFNAGIMDYGKQFKFYKEGTTPRVCLVLEKLEMELSQIFERLNIKQLRFYNWAYNTYGVQAESIYEAIQKIKAYNTINSPPQLVTRYFTEDVPNGLVPLASLGKYLGIFTPTIDSIIYLSSILCNIDFYTTGRTIENLNIMNLIDQRMRKEPLSLADYFTNQIKQV